MPSYELSAAVRAGRRDAAARAANLTSGGNRGNGASGTVVGTLHRFTDLPVVAAGAEQTTATIRRAEVTVYGQRAWLEANPGTYVLGGTVSILTVNGKPTRVLAAIHEPRDEAETAQRVTHLPELTLDPAARQANAEAHAELEQAKTDLTDAMQRLGVTEDNLAEATALIEDVRSRVTSNVVRTDTPPTRPGDTPGAVWVQREVQDGAYVVTGQWEWEGLGADPVEDYTTGEQWATAEALGDGRVRFITSVDGPHDWSVASDYNLGNGKVFDHTFTTTGTKWVRVRDTDGRLWQGTIVVDSGMLAAYTPPAGWREVAPQSISIEHLSTTGGPLDPDTIAEGWVPLLSSAFAVVTEAFIGPNALIENAVEAQHIRASKTMSAKMATFLEVTTSMLNVVNESGGGGWSLQPDGLRGWSSADVADEPTFQLTFGGLLNLIIMGNDGRVAFGAGEDGAWATNLSVEDELLVGGRPMNDAIQPWRTAWGIQAYGYRADSFTIANGERAILELSCDLVGGRSYALCFEPLTHSARIAGRDTFRIRLTTGDERPELDSPIWRDTKPRLTDAEPDPVGSATLRYLMNGAPGALGEEITHRFLMSARAENEMGLDADSDPFRMWIEDIGPTVPDTGVHRDDSSASDGTPINQPTKPAERKKRTATFYATSFTSFQRDGDDVIEYGVGANEPVQGYHPDAAGYGTKMVQYYFDYGAIQAELDGAIPGSIKAEFRLFATYWAKGSGGTARLHTHDYAAGRSTFGTATFVGDASMGARTGRWLGVPGDGWRTGSIKGIALSPRGSRSLEFYGKFATPLDANADRRPRVTFTWYE